MQCQKLDINHFSAQSVLELLLDSITQTQPFSISVLVLYSADVL
jgi:hypothetical protein